MSPNTRWVGHCTGCDREGVDVESRDSHAMKVLCDRCAAKPHKPPAAPAGDFEAVAHAAGANDRARKRQVVLTSASTIRSEAVRWMWRDRARGGPTPWPMNRSGAR